MKKGHSAGIFLAGVLLFTVVGCGGEKAPPTASLPDKATATSKPTQDASRGDRERQQTPAAVTPPNQTHPAKDGERSDLPRKVAVLPFRNLTLDPDAGETVRRLFFNFFRSLNYDAEPMPTVDRRLREHHLFGPLLQGGNAPLERVCQALGVDAVIRAVLSDYGRREALVQAQRQVTLQAELVRCQGNQLIWSRKMSLPILESDTSLHTTGQALSAIRAFIGHRRATLLQTATRLCLLMTQELPNPKRASDPPPRITFMAHSGAGRFLLPGQILRIVVIGEAGLTGSWDVGPGIVNQPLQEKSPGMYVGAFSIREKDRVIDTLPVARLTTRSGVVNLWEDILGGVNIGRLSPLPGMVVKDTTLTAAQGPYMIHPALMVQSGATLTIEAGAVIWVRGRGIVVKGALVVLGSPDRPVRLQSATSEISWEGIFLDHTQRPNTFANIFISGARYGINAQHAKVALQAGELHNNTWGVVVNDGELDLQNSHILNSEKSGLTISESRGFVGMNRIIDNRGGGIQLRHAQVRIENNDIYGNTPWEIRNLDPGDPFTAPQNWWGRSQISEVPLQGAVSLDPPLRQPATSQAGTAP
ncbi:MAG: right-handed parallel beta-helix repeat-containing protein [Magnetococcales bacterium]|nr:right-handed parallel beta-helix repeat-containing protein [Magnetococcales bacterium]